MTLSVFTPRFRTSLRTCFSWTIALLIALATIGCTKADLESGQEQLPASRSPFRQLTSGPGNETSVQYSPDGSFIVYSSDQGGNNDIYKTEIKTGKTVQLTAAGSSDSRPSWSPDGASIAFQSDRSDPIGIWIMSSDGADPRRLTDRASYSGAPAWSPDGRHIVYQGDAGDSIDIWMIEVATGETVQVTDHPDNEWHPQWSADGLSIVFYTTWGDAMTDIWTIRLEDGELTQITDRPSEDYRPIASPDGRFFVFLSNRDHRPALWAVAPGGVPFRLTDDQRYRDYLAWSPDGSQIAFSTLNNASMVSVPVSGGAASLIGDGDIDVSEPAYSPDGTKIAFLSRFEREQNVWIMPTEGGQAQVLAGINEFQESPAWSPDGQSIAFVQGKGGDSRSAELYVASIDGGEAQKITDIGWVETPVWCGHGRNIVFSAGDELEIAQLYTVDPDDGNLRQLTHGERSARPSDCLPDGEHVAFTTEVDDQKRIFKVALAGGEAVPIDTRLEAGGEGARWSPDGNQMAFVSSGALYILSTEAGSRAEEPYRIEGVEEVESWPSWSPDGSSLLVTVREGGYDIWSLDVQPLLEERGTRGLRR